MSVGGRFVSDTWRGLHAKQDVPRPIVAVILAEVRLEREKRPAPIWLAYARGGRLPSPRRLVLVRPPLAHRTRASVLRKRRLYWTLPALQQSERCDHWTRLVDIAYWQLFQARQLVADRPLPWQKSQKNLTRGRVIAAPMALLFATIGTPSQSVQTRGKSPGWPKGRKRQPAAPIQNGPARQEIGDLSLQACRNSIERFISELIISSSCYRLSKLEEKVNMPINSLDWAGTRPAPTGRPLFQRPVSYGRPATG